MARNALHWPHACGCEYSRLMCVSGTSGCVRGAGWGVEAVGVAWPEERGEVSTFGGMPLVLVPLKWFIAVVVGGLVVLLLLLLLIVLEEVAVLLALVLVDW